MKDQPDAPALRRRIAHWQQLLRGDRERGFMWPERPIDDLYEEATGLPK